MGPQPTHEQGGLVPSRDDVVSRTSDVALGPDRRERGGVLLAFGENLTACRTAAGLSQTVLAQQCFLPTNRISKMERGQVSPTLPVLLQLAAALGVPIDELTKDLAAPIRRASTKKILQLVARQPGITSAELAEIIGVPVWYVNESARRLCSLGAILASDRGWEPQAIT